MDHDRDGFAHRATSPSDPLNLLPSPVLYKGLPYARANTSTVVALEREPTDYGLFVLRATMAAAAGCGVYLGQHKDTSAIDTIPVTASQTYTAAVWVKTQTLTNTQCALYVHTQAGVLVGISATLSANGTWTRLSSVFVAPVGATHVRLSVMKVTTVAELDLYTAGWMLVAGSSAPAAFNSGSPLHWRDNIASYIRALSFGDGMRAAYEGIAQPARLSLQLNNSGGEWLPENSASPFYGTLKNGMLVTVEAELGSTVHPLWQGTVTAVSISADDADPIANLTAEDPLLLLLDTTYTPPLLQNITTGAALQVLFDSGVIAYPYPGAFALLDATGYSELDTRFRFFANWITDFDTGQTTLPYVGDNTNSVSGGVGAQAYIADLVAAELGGRFAFDARRGVFAYHDRHHDATNTPTSTTIQRTDLAAADYVWGDDIVNEFTVGYTPRHVGSAGAALYTMPNLPIRLTPGQRRTITANYTNAENGNSVGGIDMIQPVAGTDYTAFNEDGNATPTSSGARLGTTDRTADLSMGVQFGAQSAQVTLVNNGSAPIYLTLFKFRGTPLIADQRQQVQARDATSIGDYGLHRLGVELNALSNGDEAQAYADYLVKRYKQAIGRFASITLAAHKSDALMATALALGFGDYISISDVYLANAQVHYVVVGRQHDFDLGGNRHNCTLYLQPVARANWFILNDPLSALNSSVLAL